MWLWCVNFKHNLGTDMISRVIKQNWPWNECQWTSLMVNQHWFRKWLGAVRQQAITWISFDEDLPHHMAPQGRPQRVNSNGVLSHLSMFSICICISHKWMHYNPEFINGYAPGPLLETDINYRNSTWITNYFHCFLWDVMINPWLTPRAAYITKPPLQF